MKWWINRFDSFSFCFIRLFILLLLFYGFFSFGLQKELFFQIVICRFLLCEIASFCLFFFDEGDINDSILFVDVLQISSFEGLILKFSIVYFLITMFVDVEVEVEFSYEMLMYGITSEPCTGKFHGIFGKFLVMLCFACFNVLEFKYLMVVVDLA